jgi:hypothetical protein
MFEHLETRKGNRIRNVVFGKGTLNSKSKIKDNRFYAVDALVSYILHNVSFAGCNVPDVLEMTVHVDVRKPCHVIENANKLDLNVLGYFRDVILKSHKRFGTNLKGPPDCSVLKFLQNNVTRRIAFEKLKDFGGEASQSQLLANAGFSEPLVL